MARPADSLNSAVNGSPGSRTAQRLAAQARLGERDGQSSVGQVVRGGQQPGRGCRGEQGRQPPLGVEVGYRRATA